MARMFFQYNMYIVYEFQYGPGLAEDDYFFKPLLNACQAVN